MDNDDGWSTIFKDHPIFTPLIRKTEGATSDDLELSTNTLPRFQDVDPVEENLTPSGRRQVMVLKDADLLVAIGHEIRIASLGEPRLKEGSPKSFKTLHTPNIEFQIRQMCLNPGGKLLAVAGAYQVAVVVLPRPGCTRLVPATIDCKSIQIGQFYHASRNSAPIAKIGWHPWGEAGSTLLIMTEDGKFREYDISVDPEEPQQVLSFVSEKKTKSFNAEDATEREVASFTLGTGKADWGPLTVYAIMKSGDLYSICPYMPKNASVPSAYIHALECFVSAKQEFLSQNNTEVPQSLRTLYDYQRKYITTLSKQLPPGTIFPFASRSVPMHPPTTIKARPARQGPFLLQPAPRNIAGSEGGNASDVVYLGFVADVGEEDEGETERLGVVLVAYQDGKVDMCLDVEKVEARWETKQDQSGDLPMLAVYETIDLGLVSALTSTNEGSSVLGLLQANHPVFLVDPIHDDTIYVYHAFGVHSICLGPVLLSLASALRADDDASNSALNASLANSTASEVYPILTTYSVQRRASNPVIGVCIPNDVYLTYSIFILTSAMRMSTFALNPRAHSPNPRSASLAPEADSKNSELPPLPPPEGSPAYVPLLSAEPFKIPQILSRPNGFPANPRLSLPSSTNNELLLTPDTLRFLGKTVEKFSAQIVAANLAYSATAARALLITKEFHRQRELCRMLLANVEGLMEARKAKTEEHVSRIQESQKMLLSRMDRVLQSLMERASPELSEHETKWFEELKRMKKEILGASKYDEGSLAARMSLVKKEYDRILPTLKVLAEREKENKQALVDSSKSLGFSQAFEFGERSTNERAKIGDLEKEVRKLAKALDVTLTRSPRHP